MATLLPEQETTTDDTKITTADQPLELGGGETSTLGEGSSVTPQTKTTEPTEQRRSGMGKRLSNLRKYVSANVGQTMGSDIAKDIEKQRKTTEESIKASEGQVQTAAETAQARLQKGEQLVGDAGLFEQGKTAEFTGAGDAFKDYGATAEERVAEFQRYKAGEAEKIGIEDEAKLKTDISDVQRRGELTGTEKGRFELLRDQYQRPDYSRGQQRLDQLLIQSTPEQIKELTAAGSEYEKPQAQLEALQALAQQKTGEVGTRAGELAGTISTGLYGAGGQQIDPQTGMLSAEGGAIGAFGEQLAGRTEEQRVALEGLATKAASKTLNEADLTQLGVTGDTAKNFMISQKIKTDTVPNLEETTYLTEKTGLSPVAIKALTHKPTGDRNEDLQVMIDYGASLGLPAGGLLTGASIPEYRDAIAKSKAILDAFMRESDTSLSSGDLIQSALGRTVQQRVASEEDYARQAALQQLTGQRFGELAPEQAELAGTAGATTEDARYKDLLARFGQTY